MIVTESGKKNIEELQKVQVIAQMLEISLIQVYQDNFVSESYFIVIIRIVFYNYFKGC